MNKQSLETSTRFWLGSSSSCRPGNCRPWDTHSIFNYLVIILLQCNEFVNRNKTKPCGCKIRKKMIKLEKAPAILERALAEWRKEQTLKKGKTSVTQFADYLEYSQSAVSFWLNGNRPISEDALLEIIPKLAELLGEEVYEELEIDKPDNLYEYVKGNWKETSKEDKKKIAQIIQKATNKPIPNETERKTSPKL